MSDLLLVPAPPPATLGGRLGFLAPVGRQLLRALALSALVLGVAIVLNFALPRLAPGDPIDHLIPAEQASLATPDQREQLVASYGLNGSQWEQFTRYMANLAEGDLGTSTRHGRAVTSLLAERLPWTLLLVGTSVVPTLIGAALGFRSAWRRGGAGGGRPGAGRRVPGPLPSPALRRPTPAGGPGPGSGGPAPAGRRRRADLHGRRHPAGQHRHPDARPQRPPRHRLPGHHPRPRRGRAVAEQVAVMRNGRIVESGRTAEVFGSPAHPYTQTLLQAATAVGRI